MCGPSSFVVQSFSDSFPLSPQFISETVGLMEPSCCTCWQFTLAIIKVQLQRKENAQNNTVLVAHLLWQLPLGICCLVGFIIFSFWNFYLDVGQILFFCSSCFFFFLLDVEIRIWCNNILIAHLLWSLLSDPSSILFQLEHFLQHMQSANCPIGPKIMNAIKKKKIPLLILLQLIQRLHSLPITEVSLHQINPLTHCGSKKNPTNQSTWCI